MKVCLQSVYTQPNCKTQLTGLKLWTADGNYFKNQKLITVLLEYGVSSLDNLFSTFRSSIVLHLHL